MTITLFDLKVNQMIKTKEGERVRNKQKVRYHLKKKRQMKRQKSDERAGDNKISAPRNRFVSDRCQNLSFLLRMLKNPQAKRNQTESSNFSRLVAKGFFFWHLLFELFRFSEKKAKRVSGLTVRHEPRRKHKISYENISMAINFDTFSSLSE